MDGTIHWEGLDAELSDCSLVALVPSFPSITPPNENTLRERIGHYFFKYEDDESETEFENIVSFLHEDKKFLIAAETGQDVDLRSMISKGVDVQQLDSLGRNALHLAVINGNEKAIQILLQARIDPNVQDNVGCTPLSLCILRSPSLKIAKLLLTHGATISKRMSPTDTGLFLNFVMMTEPTKDEADIMRLLVNDYGALLEDPEAPGGRQALHYAAMSNNCDLINLLVSLGANLNVKNHRNQTPKDVAIAFTCKDAELLLESFERKSTLIRERSSRLRIRFRSHKKNK